MLKTPGYDSTTIRLQLAPVITMTDEELFEFCRLNDDLRIERTAQGDLLVMAPTGSGTGARESQLNFQLAGWANQDGTGITFGASAGFILPNGAMRSPDAAWVRRERLAGLTTKEIENFLPLCPDFVAELRSPSDSLPLLQAKMQEYLNNGASLGWLLDPQAREVTVYRPGQPGERLSNPATLSAEPELPGFILSLETIWDLGF